MINSEGLATIIAVLITGVFGIFQFRRQMWSTSISKSRMDWINSFRDEVSTIVATLKVLKNDGKSDKIFEAESAKARLQTRINTTTQKGNEYNRDFEDILNNICFSSEYAKCFDEISFIKFVKRILEAEWQKVKHEAKGDIEL